MLLGRTDHHDHLAAFHLRHVLDLAQLLHVVGDAFDLDGYLTACEAIAERGGTPVIFPSHGLNSLDDEGWVDALAAIGARIDRFIGFELGAMFVPYGRIPSLDAFEAMMGIDSCVGSKHSSLSRRLEWDRLAVRDRTG